MKKMFVVLMLVVFTASMATAAALDNTHMGTKAYAMGKAFTGLADDASAVFYNPAGLAFQKEGVNGQGYFMPLFTDLSYSAGGATSTSDAQVNFGGGFVSWRKGKTAFGLGVYIPYGGGSYKYEGFLGSTTTIEQSLGLVAFGGSMAIQFSPKVSLGISLTGYAGMYSFKYSAGSVVANEQDISGIAAVGGNIGVLIKPNDKVQMGLTVKLPVRITVDGTTTTPTNTYSTSAELRLPFYLTAGVAVKPNDKLTLTFDVNYAFYSTMGKYRFINVVNETNSSVQDVSTGYTDAMYFAVGAEFKPMKRLALRGGVTFTPHATEDNGLSLSCDVSHFTYSLGGEFKFTDWISLSLSAHYLMGIEREADQTSVPGASASAPGQLFNKNVFMFMSGINFQF